jgi:HNH endonuclease
MERRCTECGRWFQPSSRHLRCPACRSRDLCQCGQPKQGKSATCANCRTVAGSSNGRWRGGRTRHKAGYLMLWAPSHPRSGKGQYVFEHILVMERILGRYLLPTESVHHRNGVRDDNRPENLELWTRPQPTGIRVSDAIAWAQEILARYTGVSDTSNNAQDRLEHSWRWRESNPRPSVPHQGFSGRSLLCFSQPRRSRKLDADRLSRCLMSHLAPRPGQAVDPSS